MPQVKLKEKTHKKKHPERKKNLIPHSKGKRIEVKR